MTRSGAELLSNWVCLLGGLWVIYDNWPSVWMTILGMFIVCVPMIIDRIPQRR